MPKSTSTYAFIILALILSAAPILFGAVQPWVWPFYSAAIFTAFIFQFWGTSGDLFQHFKSIPAVAVGIFLLLTLIQSIPIPTVFLRYLSPQQYHILETSHHLLDLPLTTHAFSYNPSATLAWWLFLLSLVLLYAVLNANLNRARLKSLLWLLFGIASLEALYGIVQALAPNLGVLWVDYIKESLGNARGTYINRNHFAGYMEMMIPLMLGFTLSREDWTSKIGFKAFLASDRPHLQFFLSLGMVLMVLSLLFSKSRAGIAGFIIGLSFFLYLIQSKRKIMPMSAKITFLVISTLVLFYGIKIGFGPIFDRFLQISPDAYRLDFWRDSLPVIAAHPMGIGLGTFEQVFAVHNVSTVADIRITYLHNDFLQLLLEAGWLAFAILLVIIGWFIVKKFVKIKRMEIGENPLRFFAAAGALSGLISMLFHSCFDFNLHIPANCIYFVTLTAIVQICTTKSKVAD